MRVLVTCTGSQSREESEALPCNYTNGNQYPINTNRKKEYIFLNIY